MGTVRSILQEKGYKVWSIAPNAPVYAALQLMAEKNVGALLVLGEAKWVGIISERDYARKVELKGKTATQTPVSEIMTSRVVCVHPEQTTEQCMALMTDKRIRHLPVLEEGEVIGVISIGDVVKNIIVEQELMIQQLEDYILGA